MRNKIEILKDGEKPSFFCIKISSLPKLILQAVTRFKYIVDPLKLGVSLFYRVNGGVSVFRILPYEFSGGVRSKILYEKIFP